MELLELLELLGLLGCCCCSGFEIRGHRETTASATLAAVRRREICSIFLRLRFVSFCVA